MILRVKIEGTVTDAGLKECYETTRVYVTKTNPRAAILDIAGLEAQLSSGALRQIAYAILGVASPSFGPVELDGLENSA